MADFYRQRGRPERAVKIYESILRGDPELDKTRRIELSKALADLYIEINQFEDAKVRLNDAVAILGALGSPSIMGPIYESFGDLNFKQRKLDDAIEYYWEAAKLCKQDPQCPGSNFLNLLNNISSCQFVKQEQASIEQARNTAEMALEFYKNSDLSERKDANIDQLIDNLHHIILKSQ